MKQRPGPVLRLAIPFRVLGQRFGFLFLLLVATLLMLFGKAENAVVERVRTAIADVVTPVLEVLSRPAASVAEVIDNIGELVDLHTENARLRAENERLRHWEKMAHQLQATNDVLRDQLRLKPDPAAAFISARVIADAGGIFVRSVLVNAGAANGVRKGQAVVTGDGLAGRIAEAGERAARVLLITDLNSRVPVVLQSSRHRAVLAGDNSPRPELRYLSVNARVSPGDRVVTSGHGGAFPPGLPVGIVASVSDSVVRVEPFFDWHRLEYVRVIDYGLDGILPPPELSHTAGERR